MADVDQRRTSERDGEMPTPSQVGRLLLYDELLVSWTKKDPSRVPILKRADRCVGRLESRTGWKIEVLLQRLGCETERKDFDVKLTPGRLTMWTDYMEWVEGLLEDFDLQFDRRLVLAGASDFYKAAGEDLDLARKIVTEDGDPARYLALGESAQAWKAATRCLSGPAGERARRIHDTNQFADADMPHLSPQRLEMLNSSEAEDLLGPRVAGRMKQHIDGCPQCGRAWSRLAGPPADSSSVGALR